MAKTTVKKQSLPAQLIAAFIAVVLLTAATIGVPAIWLVRNQLDQQAWAQVEQGQRTSAALFAAQQREVANLATLIAQRPTLHDLILAGDRPALEGYLYTLESSAELDWVAVCAGPITVAAAPTGMETGCRIWQQGGYYLVGDRASQVAWFAERQAIEHLTGENLSVIAGNRLDESYLNELQQKTGLEHILCLQGQPLSASLAAAMDEPDFTAQCTQQQLKTSPYFSLEVAERPFYATFSALDNQGLNSLILLDVTDIAATQNHLANLLIAGILAVSLAVSALGVLVARRISQPLVRLSEAAAQFARGDLQTPVAIQAPVSEVAQVAQALENARLDLLQTLTHLKTERDWSEHLLASIVEGIVTLDPQGRLTFFSHGAERITG
ncbi:MAG: HAMP domain-containing protein, partial [Anaerolineales bacterium]|nr:HAMP domain-containing protein [Anaerolineales bacterium]